MLARLIACSLATAMISCSTLALAAGQPRAGSNKSASGVSPTAAINAAPSPSEADPLTPPETTGPLVAPGAEPADKPADAKAAEAKPVEVDPIVAAVRRQLAAERPRAGAAERADMAALAAFYAEGDGKPVWTGKDGLTDRGKQAIAEIEKAADWGLSRQAFQLPAPPRGEGYPDAHADAEIKLGIAALTYARHARGGRISDPSSLTRLLDRKPRLYEPKSLMQAFARAEAVDAYLRGLHPRHPQFQRLRQVLLAAQGGATAPAEDNKAAEVKIPAGPRIRPGQQHPHVALIRQRLSIPGEPGREAQYDDGLQKAVMAWQSEHGEEPTGIIGNETRVTLNGTARRSSGENVQRLIVNMERWRWMPDDLGAIHVWDSVTEQMTKVVKDGKVLFHEKIVVGKVSTPTPSFSADMQFIIFHPSWGVPDGIKMNELAPLLRRSSNSSGFLFFGGGGPSASSVLEGVGGLRPYIGGQPVNPDSVNWSSIDIRNVSFVQPPGPKNVLGVVKFRFPNKHDVYMHDTPERNLFNSGSRTFSHGCMRVQNPVRLAEVLLGHDKGWSPDRVQGFARGGGGGEIKLTTPIPVHVAYFTTTVDDDGKAHNHADIYGLDSRIATALAGRQVSIATASIKPDRPEKAERPERSEAAEAAGPSAERERSSDPAARTERQLRPRARVSRAQPSSGGSFNPFSGLFGN